LKPAELTDTVYSYRRKLSEPIFAEDVGRGGSERAVATPGVTSALGTRPPWIQTVQDRVPRLDCACAETEDAAKSDGKALLRNLQSDDFTNPPQIPFLDCDHPRNRYISAQKKSGVTPRVSGYRAAVLFGPDSCVLAFSSGMKIP